MMKRKVTAGLVGILLAAGATTTAAALVYDGSMYGQYTVTHGATISVTDNVDDGRFVSSYYLYDDGTGEGSLVNKSGYNTTVTKTAPSEITAFRPCISRSGPLPMSCGGWIH
ncbi:hypothetical protein [Actinotignum sp. GS-2025b]|uniref:hypothetical protein n=1 Tax=Actinotignum sp. GS-2025b TaxID=3427275 RepID=UPI003F489E84